MTLSSTDISLPISSASAEPSHKSANVDGQPSARSWLYRDAMKRVFDVVAIIVASPVVLPLLLILAAIISVRGGKPFYTQDRVGRNGRIFRMWKFRTMIKNADVALAVHLAANPHARAEWDHSQKLKSDPRITGFGRILRKSSIDELPQLWNVLIGDMSLVGPRPMMTDQRSLYTGTAYYRLRPGITGNWQVSKRNESAFADRVMFDQQYEQQLSFATDVSLLAATVRVVLRCTGY